MLRSGPFLICVALANLAAQEPKPAPAPQTSAPPPVLIDKVVATVNDSVILHSDLLTLTEVELRSQQASGKQLRAEDREIAYAKQLRQRIDRHTWAQAAKTFGNVPPEQVEAMLQRDLEHEEQSQVRDLGSYQAFSRELQESGLTWPTFIRERRVDKLANFAKHFSINMRMQQQANLYVTPRMMREMYDAMRSKLFVRDAQSEVALVTFRGPDAKANATKAAETWRTEELTSRELAQRFPGASGLGTMAGSALVPELAAFALASPEGAVSAPIERDREFTVAKVVTFAAARDAKFEDAEVQKQLRRLCEQRVEIEFTMQALERARQRTEVWLARPAR